MKAAMPTSHPLASICVPHTALGALGGRGVGQQREERRLVCHQRGHVVGVGRHERERGHRAATAGEHLDRADAEGFDHGVHVVSLEGGRIVDPAVLAGAAAEAARVVGDQGAVGEV